MLKTVTVTILAVLVILALPAVYFHEEISYAISAMEAKEKAQKKIESLPTKEDMIQAIKDKSTNSINDEMIAESVEIIEDAAKHKLVSAREALQKKLDDTYESEIIQTLKSDERTKPLAVKVERDVRNMISGINDKEQSTIIEATPSQDSDGEKDSPRLESEVTAEGKWSISGIKEKIHKLSKDDKQKPEEMEGETINESDEESSEDCVTCEKKWSWAKIKNKVSGN